MTNARFRTNTIPPRFEPSEVQWRAIEEAAQVEPLSPLEREDILRHANMYLAEMASHYGGLPTADIASRNREMLAATEALLRYVETPANPKAKAVKTAHSQQLDTAFELAGLEITASDILLPLKGSLRSLYAALQRAVVLVENPSAFASHTPGESFQMFVQQLQRIYEDKHGGTPVSVRKDVDSYGRYSPFVHFVFAIWTELPGMNRRASSLDSMSATLARNIMRGSKTKKSE